MILFCYIWYEFTKQKKTGQLPADSDLKIKNSKKSYEENSNVYICWVPSPWNDVPLMGEGKSAPVPLNIVYIKAGIIMMNLPLHETVSTGVKEMITLATKQKLRAIYHTSGFIILD